MGYIDFSHGGNIYEAQRKYGQAIIDFSANINPLGMPLRIKQAIYQHADRIQHYPDLHASKVIQKIAQYWGIREENILVGNGSVELIYLIASTFKPKTALIPVPTFSEYERAVRIVGARIKALKLKEKEGFQLDFSRLNKSDILFLCNPNNPTGHLIMKTPLTIKSLPNQLLVVDEAFMDFLPRQQDYTLIGKAVKTKSLVVLRSFTKFFAIPGLRIGYVVAHKEVIYKLKQHQPPWSTSSLAQLAAELILEEKIYMEATMQYIEKERRFLLEEITEIKKLIPYPSVANFLLIKIKDGNLTSASLRDSLIPEGILVRDCANFRGLNNKFFRVAVRTHKENLKLIKALKKIL